MKRKRLKGQGGAGRGQGGKVLDPAGEKRTVRVMVNLTPTEADSLAECASTPRELLIAAMKRCAAR